MACNLRKLSSKQQKILIVLAVLTLIPITAIWAALTNPQIVLVTSIYGIGVLVVTVIIYFAITCWTAKLDGDGEDNIELVSGLLKSYSYHDLQIATRDFSKVIGRGGFGDVFKGVLADGTTRIAVKRLDRMGQEVTGFLEEVKSFGSLHHFNLVRLIGYCAENSNRLLVYDYMRKGSLDKWIFKRSEQSEQKNGLDWQTRNKIILHIAKGLAYLHEDCRQRIIHLDIKPHNILLDEDFNAKISDFGLAKLIARNESRVITGTGMRGTLGYVAPELEQSIFTVKADVYSFGIVLLEIVSQRRNVDRLRSVSSFHLLQMLQKKAADQDQLIDIVEDLDEDMQNHGEEVVRMIRIGAWCLQDDHTRRPPMSTVVKALQGDMEVDPNIIYKFAHADYAIASPIAANHDHHIICVAPEEPILSSAPQASILSAPR